MWTACPKNRIQLDGRGQFPQFRALLAMVTDERSGTYVPVGRVEKCRGD